MIRHDGWESVWNAYAHATAPFRASNLPRQIARLDDFRRRDKYAIIVLDALRFDVAQDILPQYFTGDLECTWSAGHDTFQYGKRCWGDRVYGDVTYVSGATPINSKASDAYDSKHFEQLYDGWRPGETLPNLVDAWDTEWNPKLGTVPPDAVVNVAHDHLDADKLVVHCFQPHAPYIGQRPLLGHTESENAHPHQGSPVDEPVWEAVKTGDVDVTTLRAAYRANVHRACRAIHVLVDRLLDDRTVVILADHGELLADRGRRSISHPRVPFPEIRRVPWMVVDGVTTQPTGRSEVDAGETVAERLQALGYT